MSVRPECRGAASRGGFTLLEVLVAVLILALALLALMRTAAVQVEAFGDLRARTLAGWFAENLLAETRLSSALPATGSSSGHRRFGDADWRYEVRVQGTDVATIRRIDVRVFAGDDREQPVAQLNGFAGEDLAQ